MVKRRHFSGLTIRNVHFTNMLCDRYHKDYTFCEGELKQAQRDLMALMDFTQWNSYKEEYGW